MFCFVRMLRLWKEEVRIKGLEKASLNRVVFRFCRRRIFIAVVVNIVNVVFTFVGPVSCSLISPSFCFLFIISLHDNKIYSFILDNAFYSIYVYDGDRQGRPSAVTSVRSSVWTLNCD